MEGPRELTDRFSAEIRKLLGGKIRVETTPKEIRFVTTKGRMEAAFLRSVGFSRQHQIDVVAGA